MDGTYQPCKEPACHCAPTAEADRDVLFTVQAEKKQGNIVCDNYEQKISLPSDVDPERLTSGISRDGILMIRVPRRRSPERIIPIQFDAKVSAVEKAIQKSVQIETLTAE